MGPSGKVKVKEAEELEPETDLEIEQDIEDPLNDVDTIEESPFIIKNRVRIVTTSSIWKKQKARKYKGVILLVLLDGDIDKIGKNS